MFTVRRTVAVLLVAGTAGTLLPQSSGQGPDPNKVNEAIIRGGEYLKRVYARGGGNVGGGEVGGGQGLGQVALSGMAMLEAGVKPDDQAMQVVAQTVRNNALAQNGTYHLSLSILFLDRLGDPRDVPLIQFLGVRLYGGLSNLGWTYACGNHLTQAEMAQWAVVLQRPFKPEEKKPEKKSDSGFPTASGGSKTPEATSSKLHPDVARYLAAVRAGPRGSGVPGAGDNSNTQFGLIGLWVASRHHLPLDDAFAIVEAHFLGSQNRADGGWGYISGEKSTGSMTCAGLLGLAVGAARGKSKPAEPVTPKKPMGDNPFDNPMKTSGKDSDQSGPKPILPGATVEHRRAGIDAGLTAIGRIIINMQGRGGAGGEGIIGDHLGHGDIFYFCWSIERVAVAFGLDTIGDQDWYAWGCGNLLPAQTQDGSFGGGKYGSEVATAFAILFLSKSNYVQDLTKRLGGTVRDPQNRTLRGGGVNSPLLNPKRNPEDDGPAGSTIPGSTGPDPERSKPIAGLTGEPLADGLIAANAEQWPTRLKLAKETQGSEYTAALVRAIPRLDVDRRQQARDALSERLTRMKADTLRAMLKQQDPEYRRAACLASAMKEDKSHIPDLIEKITDESDLVVRAARAGLRSLTAQDFGPPGGADMAGRKKAQSDWNRWYLTSGK